MKNNLFKNKRLAFTLLLPQLAITVIFFIWPAVQALYQSLYQGDPFGFNYRFVGGDNFYQLLNSSIYLQSLSLTIIFSVSVTLVTLGLGLMMACVVSGINKGQAIYKSLLIWPYAVAPAVAAILWRFLFTPSVGWGAYVFHHLGYDWNYLIHPKQAFAIVVLASSWQQFSYNFLFYFAALQAVPQSLLEAASIDGASAWQRFWHVTLPMLSPTTFFLMVINLIYAFFDTFGVIQVLTQGGPARSTATLVYKVYNDGFVGLDYGGSAAQSVLLMIILSTLMFIQFKYIDKKVHY